MAPKNLFVLDTSALLTLRSDESGADRVEDLLARAKRGACHLFGSFMTRMELSQLDLPRGRRRRSSRSATIGGVLHNRVHHCEPSILEVAARLKRAEGYRLPIAGSAQPQSRNKGVDS